MGPVGFEPQSLTSFAPWFKSVWPVALLTAFVGEMGPVGAHPEIAGPSAT